MGTKEPIHVVLYSPATQQGQHELASRVSTAHANAVVSHIRKLNCPVRQKLALIDAVIQIVQDQQGSP